MNKKDMASVAVIGALAAVVTSAGTQLAFASEARPVNAAPLAPTGAPPSFADIVQRVAPAVVSIDVEGKTRPQAAAFGPGDGPGGGDPFEEFRRIFPQLPDMQQQERAEPMRATGSGFFVSGDGYIVTNNHVVEDAQKITVRTNDGRTLKARLVGRDPATDLAVVKVETNAHPYVNFEDRAKPRVGDWVVAVGNPFNLGGTATAGIVSALARPNFSGSSYVDYMQIDAPINRGNSGGPSFDLQGRVVGVNSAILSPTGGSVGIGFAIPADVAASVTRQLISSGKVVRGYLGAEVQEVTPEIAESLGIAPHKGALVADVVPDGPSARAGLRSGDLVMAINGHPVTSAEDLTRQVALARSGDTLHLQVRRDGHPMEVAVVSGVRPSEQQLAENDQTPPAPGATKGGLGLWVQPHAGGGLTIQGVSPDSDAAQKGLQRGDVIMQVSGRAVNSAADVGQAVQKAKASGRTDVLLMIARQGRHIFLPVEIGKAEG